MLHELCLKNYIIFDNVRIVFKEGLNVITGETGSGKSIIIDAIDILCGGRFTKEDIKSGYENAFVEGVFEINESYELNKYLDDYCIPKDHDNTLLVQREVNQFGRSTARVNGQTVTLGMLKNITQYVIDIVAQNEHQKLFKSAFHMELVDSYGPKEIKEIKKDILFIINKINEISKILSDLHNTSQERERKLDLLKYQINEIDNANLQIGEHEKLVKRKSILVNAEKLYNVISSVYEVLYDDQSFNNSVIDKLGSCLKDINSILDIDSNINDFSRTIENSFYQLDDLRHALRSYKDNIEFNSKDINVIEERLFLIERLIKKYGKNIKDILKFRDDAKSEYENLLNSNIKIKEFSDRLENVKEDYVSKANKLSEMRNNISRIIETKVETELSDLNMNGAKFFVKNDIVLDCISKNGIDKIEFMLSANPGELEKPLKKVASGGEISRIMLALKSALIVAEDIDCIVFDEIDAGIGGITANMVAHKLKRISDTKQTICITHLPQIASLGSNHLHVSKCITEDKTFAIIKRIIGNERIIELAKMLDGGKGSKLSLELAKELLDKSKLQVNNKFL